MHVSSDLVERTRPGSGVVMHVGWDCAAGSCLVASVAVSVHEVVW